MKKLAMMALLSLLGWCLLFAGQLACPNLVQAAPNTSENPVVSRPHGKSCQDCARDKRGRIQRNADAKKQFMRQSGYPHGRPGYVVDHIVPLACGGADAPSNMQWQSKADAKAKDKVERRGC